MFDYNVVDVECYESTSVRAYEFACCEITRAFPHDIWPTHIIFFDINLCVKCTGQIPS
jgi:hypothetical protein